MAQAVRYKRATLTYEEFLNWPGENQHIEWVDGEVIAMSPVTREHGCIKLFLVTLISQFATMNDLGEACGMPYNMKTGPNLPGRSPDVLFVAKANLARMKNEYLDGPADLAVEIISPGSRKIDKEVKFAEYEQGGVKEYWIVDPKLKRVDFYYRDTNGKFTAVSAGDDGIYHSRVLAGFWLEVGWLWRNPLPSFRDVLKAWGQI